MVTGWREESAGGVREGIPPGRHRVNRKCVAGNERHLNQEDDPGQPLADVLFKQIFSSYNIHVTRLCK